LKQARSEERDVIFGVHVTRWGGGSAAWGGAGEKKKRKISSNTHRGKIGVPELATGKNKGKIQL